MFNWFESSPKQIKINFFCDYLSKGLIFKLSETSESKSLWFDHFWSTIMILAFLNSLFLDTLTVFSWTHQNKYLNGSAAHISYSTTSKERMRNIKKNIKVFTQLNRQRKHELWQSLWMKNLREERKQTTQQKWKNYQKFADDSCVSDEYIHLICFVVHSSIACFDVTWCWCLFESSVLNA